MKEPLTQAQRDTYVDTTRRHTIEVLQIPEVQRRLGSYVNELFALTNSMTSVDVTQGIIADHGDRMRKTPVAVLRVGEQALRMSSQFPFDAHQYDILAKRLGKKDTDALEQGYIRIAGPNSLAPMHVFNNELGYVMTHPFNLGDSGLAHNGPLLALNYDRSELPYASAPLTLHELGHVRQRREAPIWSTDEVERDMTELSDELEGYAISAMTILGIQDAHLERQYLASMPQVSIDKALEVEEIRSLANRYEIDPYAATAKVASELLKNGHGISPFLARQIESSKLYK